MSESREKKRRYNERLEYIREFQSWICESPPRWRLFSFLSWLRRMPDSAGLFRDAA